MRAPPDQKRERPAAANGRAHFENQKGSDPKHIPSPPTAQGERDLSRLLDELIAEGPIARGEQPGGPNYATAQKRRSAKDGGAT